MDLARLATANSIVDQQLIPISPLMTEACYESVTAPAATQSDTVETPSLISEDPPGDLIIFDDVMEGGSALNLFSPVVECSAISTL